MKPLLLGKLRNNLYFVEEKLIPIANKELMKPYGGPTNEISNKDTYKSVVCLQEKNDTKPREGEAVASEGRAYAF